MTQYPADSARARLLALGLAVIAALLLWLAAIAPALDWYASRAITLERRELLAARMRAVADSIPDLRARPAATARPATFLGASDAIAGAALLGRFQILARETGVLTASTETLPPEPMSAVPSLRRIGLRVAIAASWEQLIALLVALDQASPIMTLDDLSLRSTAPPDASDPTRFEASFTVTALRAALP